MNKVISRFFTIYTKGSKLVIASAIAFSVVQSLLLLPSVYFIRNIFDINIPQKDIRGLVINSALIIGFTLLQGLLSVLHRNGFLRIVKGTVKILQRDILKTLIWADKKFYDDGDQAKIINNAVTDVDLVDKMMDSLLSVVIPQLTLFLIGVAIMLVYNPLIGISTLALGGVGYFTQRIIRKGILSNIRDYSEAKDHLTTYVDHLPSRQVLTKMRNAEELETENALRYSDDLIEKGTAAAKMGGKIKVADELVINVAATLLIIIGSSQILLGAASYGNIFGLYFLIVFIRRTVSAVQSSLNSVEEGTISLERIFALLDNQPVNSFSSHGRVPVFSGNLEVSNVSFGYTNDLVLNGINFEIKKGEIVNITGNNGIGKSSLINLLVGFYKPGSGTISADGISYDNLNLGALRTKIGYVPQIQIVLPGTIRSNLVYGLPDEAPDALSELQKTKLYDHLMTGFPLKLDTPVVYNGKNLSNGQIQRISILRALISQPTLLILDEPTNHLDGESINVLIAAIRDTLSISVLIISHHTFFKEISDKSYKLEGGKVIPVA